MDNFAGKRAKAEELLGYTCEQLREHIESQFTLQVSKGMIDASSHHRPEQSTPTKATSG